MTSGDHRSAHGAAATKFGVAAVSCTVDIMSRNFSAEKEMTDIERAYGPVSTSPNNAYVRFTGKGW